ncbi:MAG: helix-turn-helix domain-containing protein [Pseudoalteromonas spongiae]
MKTQFLAYQGIYIAFNDKLMANEHSHQFIQINLLSPQASITVDQKTLSTNCLIIASKVKHTLKSDKPVITILIDNFSVLGKKLTHLINCQKNENNVYTCFEQAKSQYLWQYFIDKTGSFDYAMTEFLNSILCHHAQAKPPTDPRIAKILNHLQQCDSAQLNLSQLAKIVNLSQSRLSHLFSEQIGMPFKSYQRYLRFKRLIPLLANGFDLTKAAHQVGFSDAAHLSRECKKLFGIQPKQLKGTLTFEQV